MSKNAEIVGLGYCGQDHLCLLPYIPVDDKVEIIQSLSQGGGPAATAIYAAQRLGGATAFVGAVGDDEQGQAILDGLKNAGVDVGAVRIRKNSASPAAFCWIGKSSGKRSIAWTRGDVKPLAPHEIDVALIAGAKVLHLDGHHTEAAIHAAKTARANGVTVSIDAGTMLPNIANLVELADIVIASEKFAEKFTCEKSAETAVRRLYKGNCRFAAVTLGSAGCVGFDGKTILHQESFKVDIVDTTGAGDVFHGAFAYKYVNGGNWCECMRFATAVAALKCTKFGGRTGIPTLVEVKRFLQENE
jgi:sulfofructose kinase